MSEEDNSKLAELNRRLNKTLDDERDAARKKRHDKGYRTARENLEDLVDSGSFNEYGQLAVAAQRSRRDYEELQTETAADGIITGLCNINRDEVGENASQAVVIINDFSVLAGTPVSYTHLTLPTKRIV